MTANDSRRPHLLYVGWGYPPGRGPGRYRTLATSNAFARAGWDVTVLTVTRETIEKLTGTDPEAEKAIDPRVRVVRAEFDASRGEADLAKWSRSRIFSPLLWNFLQSSKGNLAFPETTYGAWRDSVVGAARAIHSEHPVDLVIGTGSPYVDFAPGDYLRRRFGIPYVMDFRDGWHLDVYTGKRIGRASSRASRTERRLLSKAIEAWFVNKPIRDWYAKEYPANGDSYTVVANGFDPNFLDLRRDHVADAEKGVTIGYLGTIYGPVPLRETLEGWALARSRSPLVARSRLVFRGSLGLYAIPNEAVLATVSEFADQGVSYGGPVSKTEVSSVYREFDALALIISKSRYVTSGKVFEYAATGLPIAALHDPETAATSVLEGYPHVFPIAAVTVEDIAETFIATAERAASLTPDDLVESQRWAMHLSRDEQIQPRIAALTERITGGSL